MVPVMLCRTNKTTTASSISEHVSKGPVKMQMEEWDVKMNMKDIIILGSTSKGEKQLLTLEVLY